MPAIPPSILLGADQDMDTKVSVYSGTVVSVDTSTYEMRVYLGQNGGVTEPIEIPSLYFNTRNGSGSGAHILPEVGAEVWILRTSDGKWLPLSYHGAIGDNFRNSRPEGIEGDIMFGTTDDNFIGILRGGSIVVEAGALCKMLMDPFTDTFTTISSNYEKYTLPFTEEHLCEESRDCTSILKYFRGAEEDSPCVEKRFGSGSFIYSFEGRDVKKEDHAITSSFDLDSKGVFISTIKKGTIDVTEDISVGLTPSPLVKTENFVGDLSTVLSDLKTLIAAVELAATALGLPTGTAPSTQSVQNMITKLNSGFYNTDKLKAQ
jgi:hypothetical protein